MISITMTPEDRKVLLLALGIAQVILTENANLCSADEPDEARQKLSEQLTKQARKSRDLQMWLANAESIIIEERSD